MKSLTKVNEPQAVQEAVLAAARKFPECTVLTPEMFTYIAALPEVEQAFEELTRTEDLIYMDDEGVWFTSTLSRRLSIKLPPYARDAIIALAEHTGEQVAVPTNEAANYSGLIRQVAVRHMFLTSGDSRMIKLGRTSIEMKHAPSWQLLHGDTPPGLAIKSFSWMGEHMADKTAKHLQQKLRPADWKIVVESCPELPVWVAQAVRRHA